MQNMESCLDPELSALELWTMHTMQPPSLPDHDGGVMENVICTVVQEKTAEEFISVLNKYGVCTDYSNDYERSKAIQGIFVGVINKVHDVVWKGEDGHSEHDALVMSVKSLISSTRESEPFRVAFIGNIVSQLVEVNLKEGDGIAALKPKFFYALDIPTLCVGAGNVVVWVAKGLKELELTENVAKSSDENQCGQTQKKQSNGTNNNRKRLPLSDEDSDTHSVGESSTSGTLQHNVQIFRSRPVDLKRPPTKELVPDSTTRTVVQRGPNNVCIENKTSPEKVFGENIVSQNTANLGSAADISCRNESQINLICNLDSAMKSNKDLCCSHHNVANNTCGVHSHVTTCKTKCCNSRVNRCSCHTIAPNHFKENCCSYNNRLSCACNNRPPCTFFNHHSCPCTRNCCCGHNAPPQCMQLNSAHLCRTNNSSCNKNLDHQCRSVKSCYGPCHSQIKQCCASPCQNVCMKSKQSFCQNIMDKTNTLCCNKQITTPFHCYNNSSCCCNHEKINTPENVRVPHCCGYRNKSNTGNSKHDSCNEEVSIELSEESHKRNRIKEWVHNWVGDPPHLLPDIEVSDHLETSSQTPSLESRHNIEKLDKTCNNQRQNNLISSYQVLSSNPTDCVSNDKPQKPKKKKLFSPIENSTIISAKSVYCNSTIVEESTPFDSENPTPQDGGLPSCITQESKDNNGNLPLSDNINLDDTLDVTSTDPLTTNDVSNSVASVGERLCSGKITQESADMNQIQNEEALSGENKISSEEQFPELRIELPIVSQENTKSQNDENRKDLLNKTNEFESNMADHIKGSCLNDNENSIHHPKESSTVEKIDEGDHKEISNKKPSDVQESECGGIIDLGANKDCEPDKTSHVEVVKSIDKNNKSSSCHKRLALQNYSKSRSVSNTEDMDFTLIRDKTIDKEGIKRSKEGSDDAMELTCESLLIKRRRKEHFRKARSVGSLSSGRNVNDLSGSSTGTYYDARSDGILSLKSNKWCLKPIKEVFDKPSLPLIQKIMKGLSSHSGSSYNLNLFSKFDVTGAIVNILPNLSQESYGNLVEGFCNEGCRTEYSYNELKEMELMSDKCTFCRYSYHLTCPGCSEKGKKYPLCIYYRFEVHLFDGENVLRIEVDHKSGVDFLGCTPQMYLNSDNLYKKINKVIFPISQEESANPVLLKAKIKVMPKSGASVLTFEGTSLRKDLTLKGKHYKL